MISNLAPIGDIPGDDVPEDDLDGFEFNESDEDLFNFPTMDEDGQQQQQQQQTQQQQQQQTQQQQPPSKQQSEGESFIQMLDCAKDFIKRLLKEKEEMAEMISAYTQQLSAAAVTQATLEATNAKLKEEKYSLERVSIGFQSATECLEVEKKNLLKENEDLKKALKDSQREVKGIEYELKQSEQLWRDLSNLKEDIDLDKENSGPSEVPAIPPKSFKSIKIDNRKYLANLPPSMSGEEAVKKRKAKEDKINASARLHKEARKECQRVETPESQWGTHSTPPVFHLK